MSKKKEMTLKLSSYKEYCELFIAIRLLKLKISCSDLITLYNVSEATLKLLQKLKSKGIELDLTQLCNEPNILIDILKDDITHIDFMNNLDLKYDEKVFDEIYNICKEKYVVTDNSPIFIRKNFKLVKEALINSTISVESIIADDMDTNQKIELINICLEKGIEKVKYEKLYNQFLNDVCCTSLNEENRKKIYLPFDSDIKKIPMDVNEVYFYSSDFLLNSDLIIDNITKYQSENPDIRIIIERGSISELMYGLDNLKKLKGNIYFEIKGDPSNLISLKDAIETENFLELMIKDINDSNMSPYERYQSVYHIVTNIKEYKYYKDNKINDLDFPSQSRDIYSILNSPWIVCEGYTNLLMYLSKKVGINTVDWCVDVNEERHSRIYLNIVDEKYNINGYYMADPTFDSTYYEEHYSIANYIVDHSNLTTEESHTFDNDKFDFSKKPDCLNDDIFSALTLEKISLEQQNYIDLIEKLDPEFAQNLSKKDKEEYNSYIYNYLKGKLNNPISVDKTIDAYLNIEKIKNKNFCNLDMRLLHNEYVVKIVYPNMEDYFIGFNEDIRNISTSLNNIYCKKTISDYPCYYNFLIKSSKIKIDSKISTEHFSATIDTTKKALIITMKSSYESFECFGCNTWSEFLIKFKETFKDKYELIENSTFNLSVIIPIPEEVFNMDISNAIEYLKQLRDECLNNLYNQKCMK